MSRAELSAIAGFLNSLQRTAPGIKVVLAARTDALSEGFVGGRVPTSVELARRMPLATKAVIEDFLRVAATAVHLRIPSHLVRPDLHLVLAEEAQLDRIFDNRHSLPAAWKEFRSTYPGAPGLIRISRAGVDERSGQALLYFSMTPEGLGGTAWLMLLRKGLFAWSVIASENVWVS